MSLYKLKLGLEVHAQLKCARKLFSRMQTSTTAAPNTRVAFADAALPGSLPVLNYNCVYAAVKAAAALKAQIHRKFCFDRKHYMYPDQPAGFQITQRFHPVANDGYMQLLKRDGLKTDKRIRIEQIQLEQDTARSSYIDDLSLIDLNRAGTGLIEIVTKPDFETADEAVAFVKKLRLMLKHLDVCTGEMEQGALRVDVNVNVTDAEGNNMSNRCEIKNLFGFSAIRHAIHAEYKRHCQLLKANEPVNRETRGWDGRNTTRLRSKEEAVDYRYFPDPLLPEYILPQEVVDKVISRMPAAPDTVLDTLTARPYNQTFADALKLVETEKASEFLFKAAEVYLEKGGDHKTIATLGKWLTNIWFGLSSELPNLDQFVDVLLAVNARSITTATAKLLLQHIANGFQGTVSSAISEFELESAGKTNGLDAVVKKIIEENADVVNRIRGGKRGAIMVLIGAVMKETQGTFDPKVVRVELEQQLKL